MDGTHHADLLMLRLQAVQHEPCNLKCVDCGDKKPTWASLLVPPADAPEGSPTLGAFCCYQCSGIHRSLGTHICFVRSITLDEWKEKEIIAMELGGNSMVNRIFEATLKDATNKPSHNADMASRNDFCRKKYKDRIYYQPVEYLDALKAIDLTTKTRKDAMQNNNFQSQIGRTNPFSTRKQGPTSEVSEPMSDADFFKSLNDDTDWIDPFEIAPATKRQSRVGQDTLSKSWHPESPNKVSSYRDQKPCKGNAPTRDANPRRCPYKNSCTSKGTLRPFSKHLNAFSHDEDHTLKGSICIDDSVTTPATVTNTSRRMRGKQMDPLSNSCHALISTSNRSRVARELSKSRHKVSSKKQSSDAVEWTEPSLDHRARDARGITSTSRPRLHRRSSPTELAHKDEENAESTKAVSDLVVEALLDFITTNTGVSPDEVKAALARQIASENETRNAEIAKEIHQRDDSHERGQNSASTAKGNRARMPQRSESFAGRNRRSTSRSKSRTNSRSRRAALVRRMNSLDDKKVIESGVHSRTCSEERKSRARHLAEDKKQVDEGATDVFESTRTSGESVERRTPFGSTRRNNSSCERPTRSRSGSRGRRRRSQSRKGRSGRSFDRPTRNGSHDGRAGSSADAIVLRQLKSQEESIKYSHRPSTYSSKDKWAEENQEDIELMGVAKMLGQETSFTTSSCSDSGTVSEASEILDDEDGLFIVTGNRALKTKI